MKRLSEIFDIRYGNSLELDRLTRTDPKNGIAYVSRTVRDNGVSAFVKVIPNEILCPTGSISVTLGGAGVLSAFLQERQFYTSRDVMVMTPKSHMSNAVRLYYCMCVTANRYRYSFGRQANKTLKSLCVPSLDAIPAWVEDVPKKGFSDLLDRLNTARQEFANR